MPTAIGRVLAGGVTATLQKWPIWKVLDLTPAARGTDWHPRYGYDAD
jgi:hypothetical protein